jgi:hypothetical protein
LPLEIKSGPPIPDEKLIKGVTLPDYVRRYDARINGRAGHSSNSYPELSHNKTGR